MAKPIASMAVKSKAEVSMEYMLLGAKLDAIAMVLRATCRARKQAILEPCARMHTV